MQPTLTHTYPRLWSIDGGTMVVVTDLHGDWEAYTRCRHLFGELYARDKASWFVITGDLVHKTRGRTPDRSLDIVLDLLNMRAAYGEAIICLCGNHELPHLYGFALSRGATVYTPPFEAALSASGRRDEVIDFFAEMPFYLRTAAGVSLTHAGAFPGFAAAAERLFLWDHHALWAWADNQLAGRDREELRRGYAQLSGAPSYAAIAQQDLAAAPGDAHYDDLLRATLITGRREWPLLWSALFTGCEGEHGARGYAAALDELLGRLGAGYVPQRLLVTGHIPVRGGHAVVAGRQLRLASAAHAGPRKAGQLLLLDAAHPITDMAQLTRGLRGVFEGW